MSKQETWLPKEGETRGDKMLTIQETYMLSEVLPIFEKQFTDEDNAIASVIDYDDTYIDIEVLFADDTTEQMAFLRKLLTSGMTAKKIAKEIR